MVGEMNKRVVRRGLEAFFRRWWLYLLPLALFTAVGVVTSLHSPSGYQSVGVIDVSKDTLLSQLTNVGGDTFGYEKPSASTARTINSLLGTDQFMASVATRAGVTGALNSGQLTRLGMRQALAVLTDGDTLVQVVATTDNPDLSAKLAKGTIDSFIQYVIDGDISESKAAEAFFQSQLQSYRSAVEQAQQVLNDYAAKHPGGPQEQRPLAEQVEIQQLTSAVTQAQDQYSTAQQKSEEARLATEQATTNASQRLRIIDQPKADPIPLSGLKKSVMTTDDLRVRRAPALVGGRRARHRPRPEPAHRRRRRRPAPPARTRRGPGRDEVTVVHAPHEEGSQGGRPPGLCRILEHQPRRRADRSAFGESASGHLVPSGREGLDGERKAGSLHIGGR